MNSHLDGTVAACKQIGDILSKRTMRGCPIVMQALRRTEVRGKKKTRLERNNYTVNVHNCFIVYCVDT